MSVFFTSDTHFRHKNIIRFSNRPFATVEDMEEGLIERWNRVVGRKDDVYHLGDFAFGPEDVVRQIVARLNGRIHLIWGNHDSNAVRKSSCWSSSQPVHELKLDGKLIVLSHYAHRVWNKMHYGSFMLYGHSHGGLPGNSQSLDVGCDAWDYTPVTFEQCLERMKTLTPCMWEDHHQPDEN